MTLGGEGLRGVSRGVHFKAAIWTLNHCLEERTYVVVASSERVGSCSLKERGSNPGSRIAAPPEARDLPSGPRIGGGMLLVRDATFSVYIGLLQLTWLSRSGR